MKLPGSTIHYLWKIPLYEKSVFFHFSGQDKLKNDDNSKSLKNELLGFAMNQEYGNQGYPTVC